MNIAVLVRRFITTGGAEKYAVEITQRLRDKGHHITLYSRMADKELARGMDFIRVSDRFRFSGVLSSLSFARETERMIRGKTYDVVHSHERGYAQDITTVHTFCYLEGTRHYSFLKKIFNVRLSPRAGLYLRLEKKQMDSPCTVAVSEIIRENIREYYNPRKKIPVISPGVDMAWFHPRWIAENRDRIRREEKIPEKELLVLFVGSEFRRKGLDFLIPALGEGMHLFVLGKGESEKPYQNLAHRCGIGQRIHFKGLSDDIRRYYAAADLLVLPSRLEAFGMSALEGMACGLPVVVSHAAGVSALIENSINGFVFHDPSELSGILQRLRNPSDRKKIGEQAEKTSEKYTWDIVADRYEELYRQRIAEKK